MFSFDLRKGLTYVSQTEQWWQRSGFSTWQRSQNLIAGEKMRRGWINDTWAEPTLQPPPEAKKLPLMIGTNERHALAACSEWGCLLPSLSASSAHRLLSIWQNVANLPASEILLIKPQGILYTDVKTINIKLLETKAYLLTELEWKWAASLRSQSEFVFEHLAFPPSHIFVCLSMTAGTASTNIQPTSHVWG